MHVAFSDMPVYISLVISQTAEYALRAITFLADREGESHTSDAISSVTKVPAGYLAKILQGLAKGGLINSQRGPYGGFRLAVNRDELTVLAVIQAVDPLPRIESCPLRIKSHVSNLCPLHQLLDDVLLSVQEKLGDVTVGDLIRQGGHEHASTPLCDFPRQLVPNPKRAVRRNSAADG